MDDNLQAVEYIMEKSIWPSIFFGIYLWNHVDYKHIY